MTDKFIYLISYKGGMFGEFVCSCIADDPSFYKVSDPSIDVNTNRYFFKDILDHRYGVNLVMSTWVPGTRLEVSDEVRDQIDIELLEKNICVRSHQWPYSADFINLNRIKKVKLFVSESDSILAFLLSYLKVSTSTFLVDNNHINNIQRRTSLSPNICVGDTMSMLTYTACLFKVYPPIAFVKKSYPSYRSQAMSGLLVSDRDNESTYLNVGTLMIDPESVMPEWADALGLSTEFDYNKIREYHQSNLALIHEFFDESYDDLIRTDWLSKLSNRMVKYVTPLTFS